MIEIPEFNKVLIVLGFTNVKISCVTGFLQNLRTNVETHLLQVFDARYIVGKKHLLLATLSALNAFDQQRNISNNLAVEILLYTSGQRQIRKAIEAIGLKEDTEDVVLIALASSKDATEQMVAQMTSHIPGKRDDRVIDLHKNKVQHIMTAFEIGPLELQTALQIKGNLFESLESIVIERNALLTIQR